MSRTRRRYPLQNFLLGVILFLVGIGGCSGPDPEDSAISLDNWQAGGTRIVMSLGASFLKKLSSFNESPAPRTLGTFGACLRLYCDFVDPARFQITAYNFGEPIPGKCQSISFVVSSPADREIPPGISLSVQIEDAWGRWYRYSKGLLVPSGSSGVTSLPISLDLDDSQWVQLLRNGETAAEIIYPIRLRQILFSRTPAFQGTAYFDLTDLVASTQIVDLARVKTELQTGRYANLFYQGETPTVTATLTSTASSNVSGTLTAYFRDFFGQESRVDLGSVTVTPGTPLTRSITLPTPRLGSWLLRLELKQSSSKIRHWFHRFAVSSRQTPPVKAQPGIFGINYFPADCYGNTYNSQDWDRSIALMQQAGITWLRSALNWTRFNPAENVWVWEYWPEFLQESPRGTVLQFPEKDKTWTPPGSSTPRTSYLPRWLATNYQPLLDLQDGVSIAGWARTPTLYNRQWLLARQISGPGGTRSYGAFLQHRYDAALKTTIAEFGFEGLTASGPIVATTLLPGWKDSDWHHYAAVYSATAGVQLYVDGQACVVTTQGTPGPLACPPTDLLLGLNFHGALDEILLYRRALAATEVVSLSGGTSLSQGRVGWWQMAGALAQKERTVVSDASGNGFDFLLWEVRQMYTARDRGLHTMFLLYSPPRWASSAPPGDLPMRHPPKETRFWTDYLTAMAARYGPRVKHWELCNEPNLKTFWDDGTTLQASMENIYTKVLRPGYLALKAVDPGLRVIAPGIAGPLEDRRGMDALSHLFTAEGGNLCADTVSLHPYRQAGPEESDLANDLLDISRQAGGRPLWFTENCWNNVQGRGSTEERAARMLARCYVLSLSTGKVERMAWFRLRDFGLDPFYDEHNYGLCYYDLTPKSVYFAHRTVALLLDGTTAETGVTWDIGPRALARSFSSPSGRIVALWCPEGTADVSLFVNRPTVSAVDLMGNPRNLPTQDGILRLTASEDMLFLTGLDNACRGLGDRIRVTPEHPWYAPRTRVNLTLALSNPFPVAVRPSFTLPHGFSLKRNDFSGTSLAAGKPATGIITIEVASSCEPGRHWGLVTLSGSGRTLTEDLLLEVHPSSATAGPVGFWKCEETSGSSLLDSSGSNRHAPLSGSWTRGAGAQGRAIFFQDAGTAQRTDSAFTLEHEFTIAFWIRADGPQDHEQNFLYRYAPSPWRNNYYFRLVSSVNPTTGNDEAVISFYASFSKVPWFYLPRVAVLPFRSWHHVAVTYSELTCRLQCYLDGSLVLDRLLWREGRPLAGDGPLVLGSRLHGGLDNVILFPRALNRAEIQDLMR